MLNDLWFALPATSQDTLLLLSLLMVPLVLIVFATHQYRLVSSVASLLRYHWSAGLAMVSLIIVATSINLLSSLHSASLVNSSARAADPFDLIVAAPGNDIDTLLSVIYLKNYTPTLLKPQVLVQLQNHASVRFVAPVGFGDSIAGYPIIGTSNAMLSHLALHASSDNRALSEVQTASDVTSWFSSNWSAVPGAATTLSSGERVRAQHGAFLAQETAEHSSSEFTVQSPLPFTGTPWDFAVMVPIASLWELHGLGVHDNERYNVDTPGVPAVVVKAESMGDLYQLRQEFNDTDSMAFFPAEVLTRLYGVMNSASAVLQWITMGTQVLVVSAVLLCAYLLLSGLREQFQTLHNIGAPYAFRFFTIWLFVATLIIAGIVIGLIAGWLLALAISQPLSHALGLSILPTLTLRDFISTAQLLAITLTLATLPAWLLLRKS